MRVRSDIVAGLSRAGTTRTGRRCLAACAAVLAVAAGAALSAPATAVNGDSRPDQRWTAAWGASPVAGAAIPWMPNCQAGAGLTEQTVRNVLFLSAGGTQVRIRLSNTFGTTALAVGRASVAVQAGTDATPVGGTAAPE